MTREEAIKWFEGEKEAAERQVVAFESCFKCFKSAHRKIVAYNDMAISALMEQCVRDATKTSGWISVKDRRPEYKTRVLFVDVRGLVFLAIDSVDWEDDRVSFLEPASGLWVQGSHWMPLPEPPKEEV